MSTIFGLYHSDQRPVDISDAECIQKAMQHWQPDDKGMYIDGEIMLGQLMLHNTPESFHEKLPYITDNKIITADCRLDNREDILNWLQEFPHITGNTPDSLLILFLYLKFGSDCVQYLEGDFVFVIFDKFKRTVFAARDRMGVKPFYYYKESDFFVFASEKKGILSLEKVNKEINEKFVYQIMAEIEPELEETFHKHIYSLPPAHTLTVTNDNFRKSCYWRLDLPQLLNLKKEEDYIDAFRAEMTRAVKCRLRTVFPVAVELSGGLDSSGITGLAAKLIADKDKLFSFSNVMPVNESGEKEYADEEKFIDEVIQFNGIRNFVKNTGSNWKNFLEPHELNFAAHSGVEAYSAWWQEPLRKAMADRGIRVTLSGFPGDEAITNNGSFYFHDFIREGKYIDFLKVALEKKQYDVLLKKIISNVLPDPVVDFIRKPKSVDFKRNSFLLDLDLESDLVREFQSKQSPHPDSYKEFIAHRVTRPHSTFRMQSETSFSIRHRLEPRYPLADTRLLSFFLSLPSALIGHPQINRYMFRRGMEGLMPENIRWRVDKKAAPLIYFWRENRLFAGDFYEWANKRHLSASNNILKKMDIQKLIRGYDTGNPANYYSGIFKPSRPFEIELLLYYFSMV